MSFIAIIPARYASTRLPGKPLADIHGKPMVVHVMERARESGASRVIVATDHPEVAKAVGSRRWRSVHDQPGSPFRHRAAGGSDRALRLCRRPDHR